MSEKTYSQMAKASKSKLVSVHKRLYKNGYKVQDVLSMTDLEIRQNFNMKKSAVAGFKRNVKSLQLSLERKKSVSNDTLKDFVKQKFRGKGLSRVNNQLRKTIGLNIFFDIVKKVQDEFNLDEQESYSRTRSVLRLARLNYRRLSNREIELLSYFS